MTRTSDAVVISEGELLARFITAKGWIRQDGTVRPDAFSPPSDLQLSVTRHLNLSNERLWRIGQAVVDSINSKPNRPAVLLGRADIVAKNVHRLTLHVEAAPLPENENHAHLTGWPSDKPAQKMIALELAKESKLVSFP